MLNWKKVVELHFFVLTLACIVHLVFLKALTSIIITLLSFITQSYNDNNYHCFMIVTLIVQA